MKPFATALFALTAAFVLAGCEDEPPIAPPTNTAIATATPTRTPTPTVDVSPPAVEGCGIEDLPQGAAALDGVARDCLLRAFQAGRPARFTTTRPTIEGDPITTRVEVLGPADLRVTVDMTRDRFSAPSDRVVRTYRCTTLTRGVATGALRPLIVNGCTDGASFEV